jgi:gamma-glutamyltranspeptidase/glutathione hydrolase
VVEQAVVVHGPPGSAAVAGGSAEAVAAAIDVLRSGGSAVDAVLAAAFATTLTEPVLSSLGGGGFLLRAPAGGAAEVLDFFVAVPGLGRSARPGLEGAGEASAGAGVQEVVVDFAKAGPAAGASRQVFHGGWGTVAVPGAFAGYLDAHARWGRLPLADVVAPAARLARDGVELSAVQRRFVTLVADLLALTPESARLFAGLDRAGAYRNLGYADLLDAVARGEVAGAWDPAYADELLRGAAVHGGLLSAADLEAYAPVLRDPLVLERGDARISTNPPPSAGGAIVLEALRRYDAGRGGPRWHEVAAAQAEARLAHRGRGQVPTGTTHLSVVDRDGGVAALTTSNGSGSGTVVPRWHVPLNNMLGEEDLQPGEPLPPGARMGSMMAPTLLEGSDGSRTVLGTGGSERIRSAVLGVVLRLVDEGAGLADAVSAPRVHIGSDHQVHVEPGLPEAALAGLDRLAGERGWPGVEQWPTPNVYFGGVHAVSRARDGSVTAVGDARRGGAAAVLPPG